MRKIFTLIASLMMVLSMNAATKTIYCKMSQSWWKDAGASVGAYMWKDGGESTSWPGVKMTPVVGETDLWSVDVDTDKYQKIIFTRLDGAGTSFWGAQTNDLTVPTNANNLYTITQSSAAWADQGKKCTGSWGTYTPPAVVVIPDRYLTGTLAGGWNANDVKMTYDEANEIYTHTFTSVAAGEEHQLKVTDGSWNNSWGGNNVYPAIDGVTADKDGNAVFTLSTAGDVTVTFDGSNIQITTTGTIKGTPKFDYYVVGSFNGWTNPDPTHGMTLDGEVYKATITLAAGENLVKVTNGTWTDAKGFSAMGAEYEEVSAGASDDNIMVTLAAGKDVVVVYNATTKKVTFEGLTEKAPAPTFDYYICGSFNSNNPKNAENGMTLDGTAYKATVTLAAGDNTLKVTDGTWDKTWGANELGAAYEEVSNPNDYNNIKITLAAEKEITVIFDATAGKITFTGLTEKVITPVTVYFINSGEWAEVACYYWGGLNASTWPGVQMTATGETYEAEGWNVYKVTFPGDNTTCIFNDNKAEGATQTGDLEVQDGKYYCYANGIWYERLADVDPLDTRVYLKGDMNEWCANYCDMFRKETVDGTVASRTTWLEAETTYEFKIEDAGTWLSNEGTMDKDNCTGWEFTEGADNAKITTEYAGDYTFVWDMTTNQLSVEYPNPMANPEVMNLMVTDMVFDGDGTFSGTDNMMGIEFALVVGDDLGDGVYSLDASSTVNFGGTLFTDVTGMITPDTETFASASAVVYGFYMGMYFQLNVEMSAGASAGVPVEILDGTASVNGAGELTISGNWDGDDVYVVAPGFNGESYECEEVWFYVGGNDWKTASIIAFGPATITVDGNDVVVEGTVMSGMTGTNYDLFVIGTFPAAEPETPTVSGKFSTGKYEYAEFALGNLQYNVGTDTWAFAANQYEVIGEANINLGDPTFTGTIDMFGWSTDDEGNNYGVNPNNVNELYDGTFQDWGTKMGEGWSTLSADQWKYLLNTRNNAKNLKQIARVGSVVGIMLFPDNWNEAPVVDAEYDSDFEVNIYNYDLAQWANLEDNGAVFLPAAGRRAGGYGNMTNKDQNEENNSANLNDGYYRWQDNTNIYCYYWTSTINETTKDVAYLHNITYLGNDEYTIGTGAVWSEKGRYGQSVRLAKVTDVTPDYTRTTTAGKFGTICLPFGSTNYTGMELFECVGQETGKVYIASVTTLEAGVPYIFLATGTELAVYSDGTTAATPGDHNGLHGTFTDDTEVAVGNYILKDNALCQAATTCWVNANRAYLVMGEVPTEPVQQMPGRRYIGMSTKGENAATGLDNITNGENSVIKTIENGQLIIIRNGEKFNAQGVRF